VCSTFALLSNDEHLWKDVVEHAWDIEGTYMQKPNHKTYKWLFECKKVQTSAEPFPSIRCWRPL